MTDTKLDEFVNAVKVGEITKDQAITHLRNSKATFEQHALVILQSINERVQSLLQSSVVEIDKIIDAVKEVDNPRLEDEE